MITLGIELDLSRCPHCRVDTPSLKQCGSLFITKAYTGNFERTWRTYACSRCGGVVTAWSDGDGRPVGKVFPETAGVDEAIPDPARSFLAQALDTLHAPAGSVMLAASAIDAMLKAKSYTDGSLYTRIEKAAEDHLITAEMAQWAHEVRLDANDQRHADQNASLPTSDDAKRCVDFATALGTFLFVLPARVKRGLAEAAKKPV